MFLYVLFVKGFVRRPSLLNLPSNSPILQDGMMQSGLAAILMAGIAVMILIQAAVPLNGPAAYMRKAPRQSTF